MKTLTIKEPIWATTEKNNIITATYFWVGSEAKIGGYRPSYYKNYTSGINPKDKVDQVINWLKLPLKERPKFHGGNKCERQEL